MIVTRLRQISLLLIAMAISALAFIQMFQRTAGEFPMQYAGMLALAVVLFLVLWGLIVRFQPYASQSILPCVLLLTATGSYIFFLDLLIFLNDFFQIFIG